MVDRSTNSLFQISKSLPLSHTAAQNLSFVQSSSSANKLMERLNCQFSAQRRTFWTIPSTGVLLIRSSCSFARTVVSQRQDFILQFLARRQGNCSQDGRVHQSCLRRAAQRGWTCCYGQGNGHTEAVDQVPSVSLTATAYRFELHSPFKLSPPYIRFKFTLFTLCGHSSLFLVGAVRNTPQCTLLLGCNCRAALHLDSTKPLAAAVVRSK